jgi:CheY-like chemotaxis protein
MQSGTWSHLAQDFSDLQRNKLQKEELKPLVLIADDEPLIRSTLVQILKQQGYDTVAADDSNEAVDCVKKLLPDIFLADVSMLRLNWIEAAKFVKSISPVARIISSTGHASASDLLATAQEQGYEFEFISKPIRPDALIERRLWIFTSRIL